MKITDVETVVVTVPLVAPIRVSQGVASGTTRTVVKIHTDEKQVGIGETVGAGPKSTIDSKLKPLLIGANPFEIESLLSRCCGYERFQL
jgi:L-alanine-DL-glutamate epimerase-like enolase superfamily enzyme